MVKATWKVWLSRFAIAAVALAALTYIFLVRNFLGFNVLISKTPAGFLTGSFVFIILWCGLAGLAAVLLPNLVFYWSRRLPSWASFLLSLVTLGVVIGYMYYLYDLTAIGGR